jgi:hypothetical protein
MRRLMRADKYSCINFMMRVFIFDATTRVSVYRLMKRVVLYALPAFFMRNSAWNILFLAISSS